MRRTVTRHCWRKKTSTMLQSSFKLYSVEGMHGKAYQKNKNKETLDDLKTSHPARSSKKSDKESVSSSPSSSPINFKQPNITSNVNLSPKIAETLKSESPTSEIIRFRNNQRAPSPTKSNISNPRSRSPSAVGARRRRAPRSCRP